MKRATPPTTLDYRLRVTPFLDEREQRYKTRFILETTQSFASFVYELTVRELVDGNNIHLKVQGLKPPRLTIPSAGHAKFEREYDHLNGTCEVTLESIDGRINAFTLHVAPGNIQLLHAPHEKFAELILETPLKPIP